MNKKIIGVDIDGVLADSDALYRELIEKWYGVKLNRADVKRPNYFEFIEGVEPLSEIQKFFKRVTKEKLWQDIHPLPGAKEGLDYLRRKNYSIYIITSRPDIEPLKSETLKWLENNGFKYDKIIFITDGNKHRKIKESHIKLEYFIEDFAEYAIDFAVSGIKVILFDYPWNQYINHHNFIRVRDWAEVERII